MTIKEVYLSNAARSKTFRIMETGRVKDAVESLGGTLYRKDDIYHLIVKPEHSVVVFTMEEPGKAVVITLHSNPHYQYRKDNSFEKVNEVESP